MLPVLGSVLFDVAQRGGRLLDFDGYHRTTYAAAVLESLTVWALLLLAAARRRGALRWLSAVLFVVGFTFAIGGQAYFREQYGAYLNLDVSLFASNFMDSVTNQLAADLPNYLAAKLPVLLLAAGLVWGARRLLRPTRTLARRVGVLAPLALLVSFFVPTQYRQVQASTPDTLYLHAVGGLLRTQLGFSSESNQQRPRARAPLAVPPLARAQVPPRNVVLFILESVRADSTCIEHAPGCRKTAYSNELLPDRTPLLQMRSLASSTAISLAVLWTGIGPHESRDALHTWPSLFEYARAAGYDTAFWTSQNMLFGNSRLWVKDVPVTKLCTATELDPASDLDMGAPERLLAARVNAEIGQLKEPFLAVIQLSNAHYPYYVEPGAPEPFQPTTRSKAAEDNAAFKNYYQNAIHQQDRHVASIIAHLRRSDAGQRTVLLYTSDHGEAFREHGQMGHTFSLFDEEIHVPGWIDAPRGTLTEAERSYLHEKKHAFTFHVDLPPTILDLMGVWDAAELGPFRAKMLGTSLLRPGENQHVLPMTNCSGVWSCAFENWGVMRRNLKLHARAWGRSYQCYDVLRDPRERNDLGVSACGDLAEHARRIFPGLPGESVPKPAR